MSSATELLERQRSLSRWKLNWARLWANESDREQVAVMAQEWCVWLCHAFGKRLQQQSESLAS